MQATYGADALDDPDRKLMDFPRFVNAIVMVAEECRKPSRAPQSTRGSNVVTPTFAPLGSSPPLASDPALEPARQATPSPERALSSPRRELQPILAELPADDEVPEGDHEQADGVSVPLRIPGLDQHLIRALHGDDHTGIVEEAERNVRRTSPDYGLSRACNRFSARWPLLRVSNPDPGYLLCLLSQELLPRTFGMFATPVDTDAGSLADTHTRELERAPGAENACVLDLHAYRELMGAVFPAGAPGLEEEDVQNGWPSAHDPDGVAPSVYRLATASFLAVGSHLTPALMRPPTLARSYTVYRMRKPRTRLDQINSAEATLDVVACGCSRAGDDGRAWTSSDGLSPLHHRPEIGSGAILWSGGSSPPSTGASARGGT